MPLHYQTQFNAMMAGSGFRVEEIDVAGELVFRLHRGSNEETARKDR